MNLFTPDEMREADRIAIEERGIPGLDLMERAGEACAREATAMLGDPALARVVVLVYKGNNGGDGSVIARLLAQAEANVTAVLFAPVTELAGDALVNWKRLEKTDVTCVDASDGTKDDDVMAAIRSAELVVDAIFGTGFAGAPRGRAADAVRMCGEAGRVLSVDIPSGVNGLTGAVEGEAVSADRTVTFCRAKTGLFFHPGKEHAGHLEVADIGIPRDVIRKVGTTVASFDEDDARALWKPRRRDAHKGDFGRVTVLGGAPSYVGAPLLAGMAALRTGAGLVSLLVPPAVHPLAAGRIPELMVRASGDDGDAGDDGGMLDARALNLLIAGELRADVLAVGPGMGRGSGPGDLVGALLDRWKGPVVVDADGIHAAAEHREKIASSPAGLVFTPHLGEFVALTGQEKAVVAKDPAGAVARTAHELNAVVLLKGNPTLVGDPSGFVTLNTTGNPGMATAGSGDVLTGMIAALIGQGYDAPHATRLAVWIHGRAGDIGAGKHGEASLIASDIIASIRGAIATIDID
ncbi:MAG: NAD(P)H-hydrate dehydratase [Gemmatimonadetes bacterium]|nr:NAD(P)H-hydrate dehydratase [Gemmatimonadota bacterium]